MDFSMVFTFIKNIVAMDKKILPVIISLQGKSEELFQMFPEIQGFKDEFDTAMKVVAFFLKLIGLLPGASADAVAVSTSITQAQASVAAQNSSV